MLLLLSSRRSLGRRINPQVKSLPFTGFQDSRIALGKGKRGGLESNGSPGRDGGEGHVREGEGGRPLPHRRTRRGTAGPPRAGKAPTPGDGPPGGVAGLRDRSAAREGPRRAAADDFRRQGKRRSGANAGLSEAVQTPPTWRGRRVPTEGTSILLSGIAGVTSERSNCGRYVDNTFGFQFPTGVQLGAFSAQKGCHVCLFFLFFCAREVGWGLREFAKLTHLISDFIGSKRFPHHWLSAGSARKTGRFAEMGIPLILAFLQSIFLDRLVCPQSVEPKMWRLQNKQKVGDPLGKKKGEESKINSQVA